MKKIIIVLILISLLATPCYAITLIDKMIYREVLVKSYNQRLLVGRFTGEVKYIWQRPTPVVFDSGPMAQQGEWQPFVNESVKKMWQEIYDRERGPKKDSD